MEGHCHLNFNQFLTCKMICLNKPCLPATPKLGFSRQFCSWRLSLLWVLWTQNFAVDRKRILRLDEYVVKSTDCHPVTPNATFSQPLPFFESNVKCSPVRSESCLQSRSFSVFREVIKFVASNIT